MSEDPILKRAVYQPTKIGEYLIIAEAHEYYCEFTCYDCMGMSLGADGGYTTPLYTVKDAIDCSESTENSDDAQVFLSGSIKWDGCANLTFDEQETAALHFCGRSDAQRVGKLLDRLYDLAGELIPKWDAECAT